MGQENSSLVDENTPPQSLEHRTVKALADYIIQGQAKKIVVMSGAGISTSAGIPDFRSAGTGLYANLAKLDLPYPEAVFDISYFRNNPLPFYALAHEIYPGNYSPTISHYFIRLLSDKGLLLKLFTQNIDCLERAAGVPESKIVEAHGSFAHQRCIDCKKRFSDALMKEAISNRQVPYCSAPECNGLIKPDIVFFGEKLPEDFHLNRTLPIAADLCIIMGTSLTVQPFASLADLCPNGVPRLLINAERVGGIGSRPDDVLLLGDCDSGVRTLASALGWAEGLEALWQESVASKITSDPEQTKQMSKDEILEDEIANLTKAVELSLQLTADHNKRLRDSLADEHIVAPSKGTPVKYTDSLSAQPLGETPKMGPDGSKLEMLQEPPPSVSSPVRKT